MRRAFLMVMVAGLSTCGFSGVKPAVEPLSDVSQVTAYYVRCDPSDITGYSCRKIQSKAGAEEFTVIISQQRVIPRPLVWTFTDCKVTAPTSWSCMQGKTLFWMQDGVLRQPSTPRDSVLSVDRATYCQAPDTVGAKPPAFLGILWC